MQEIYCPGSVRTGRPDGFGRTSGSGIFAIKFVFLPYLQISVIMCFCIIFHSNSWLYASLLIWLLFVKILVFSKFSKHMILHIWKFSDLHLRSEFKKLFQLCHLKLWNDFENSVWKIFSKLPISYLIFLCVSCIFKNYIFQKRY